MKPDLSYHNGDSDLMKIQGWIKLLKSLRAHYTQNIPSPKLLHTATLHYTTLQRGMPFLDFGGIIYHNTLNSPLGCHLCEGSRARQDSAVGPAAVQAVLVLDPYALIFEMLFQMRGWQACIGESSQTRGIFSKVLSVSLDNQFLFFAFVFQIYPLVCFLAWKNT